MMRHLRSKWKCAFGVLMLISACAAHGAAAVKPPATSPATPAPAKTAMSKPVSLKEQMRLLWPATTAELTRGWLVCGEFPVTTGGDGVPEMLTAGYANDFLQGQGGEATLRPVAGGTHTRPDGTAAAWTKFEAKNDAVDFWKALPNRPGDDVVWYAATTLVRDARGRVVFALAGRNAMKVWVNGVLVHEHPLDYETGYRDLFAVPLQAGENSVLVKVVQRSAGGFTLRVLEMARAQMMEVIDPRLAPSIVPSGIGQPETLTVASDDSRSNLLLEKPPVEIAVVAADGTTVATKTVPRGDRATFDTAPWAEGPYEVRLTMASQSGRRTNAYLLWYHGDALAAARDLVKTALTADDRTREGAVHAMLAEMVVERLGKQWMRSRPAVWPAIYPALMEYAELQRAGAEHLPDRQGGLVRLVYRDDTDDSPQFCRVYLPPGYSPREHYPVIINLHGRADEFPPYVRWGGSDQRHDGLSEGYRVITVYPHGRGNSWYRGMGDADVMRCLEMVKQRFSVDEDRVYLVGYSMGGAGTWYVGTRHPEQFAALAPFFGGYDFRFQQDDAVLAKLTPREQYRRERLSYIAQLEALRTTPVFTSHGDADRIVPVDYSRYTARLLQRWGYHVRYWEVPGKEHGGLGNDDAVFSWLLAQKRVTNPARVSIRAAELRSAAAHWVRVTQRKNPYAFMQADAEVLTPTCLRLDTANVLELELSPRAPLVETRGPVRIIWNGEMRTETFTAGKLVLRVPGYVPPVLGKRPALEGPATDLYNTPFAVVIGTVATDPLMRRMCARAAERYIAAWEERFHCRPRCFLDTEISAEDQAKYSLLLFGGPGENAVAQAMAERIPLTIMGNAITIDGRPFLARDAAVQMVYPNPLNADRYVVIRTATSAPAMALVDYVLNDVDFCIVDSRNVDPDKAAGFFDAVTGRCSGTPILAGYFDNAWRLQDAYLERDTRPRNTPVLTAPCHADADVPVATLSLAEVVESRAEGTFFDLIRNANARQQPITLDKKVLGSGIAVAPKYWLAKQPNGVEYDLPEYGWTRLRASIGLEVDTSADAVKAVKQAPIRIEFVVKGDGVELYHSPPFGYTSRPKAIEVDIAGVRTLRLEVLNLGPGSAQVTSVDWGNARLVR